MGIGKTIAKTAVKEGIGEISKAIRKPEESEQTTEIGNRPQGIRKSMLTIIVTLSILTIAFSVAIIITLFLDKTIWQRLRLLNGWGHFCVLFASMYVPIIGAVVYGTSVKYRNQRKKL